MNFAQRLGSERDDPAASRLSGGAALERQASGGGENAEANLRCRVAGDDREAFLHQAEDPAGFQPASINAGVFGWRQAAQIQRDGARLGLGAEGSRQNGDPSGAKRYSHRQAGPLTFNHLRPLLLGLASQGNSARP